MSKIVRLTVEFDPDAECPSEHYGWKLYSFSSYHDNFKEPTTILKKTVDNEIKAIKIGLQKKLKVGTAFILSCYDHGSVQWGLPGEVLQCQWDTVQVAGILIWEKPVKNLEAKTYEERKNDARNFLEQYTLWGNGYNFFYVVTYEDGQTNSCRGFIGSESLIETLKEEFPELFVNGSLRNDIEIDGDASEAVKEREY